MTTVLNRKKFLTDNPEETGSVCTKVQNSTGSYTYDIEASIKIYDCNRSVTLDFDCYNKSELPERIAKIEVLLSELLNMREALVSLNTPTKFFY